MTKKFLILTCLFIFVFSFTNAEAQIKDDVTLWTINLGFLETQSAATENNLFTYGLNTTFERMVSDSKFAFGANLGYSWSEDSYDITLDTKSWQSYKTLSIYLTSKYYFTPNNNWTPYIGFGFGFQSTGVDFAVSGLMDIDNDDVFVGTRSLTSLSIAIPLGINAFVSDNVYLGFNFTPFWLDKSFYKDKWYWVFNMGVGFQLD